MLATVDGRTVVLAAVLLQAAGKVSYGTWLGAVPSALFVFVSFSLTAGVFAVTMKTVGQRAVGWLVLLNAATAITFLAFFPSAQTH